MRFSSAQTVFRHFAAREIFGTDFTRREALFRTDGAPGTRFSATRRTDKTNSPTVPQQDKAAPPREGRRGGDFGVFSADSQTLGNAFLRFFVHAFGKADGDIHVQLIVVGHNAAQLLVFP